MRSIDGLALPTLRLIKIDVQGFEIFVLKGAARTIRESRPFIFLEIEERQLQHHDYSYMQLMDHLFALGYMLLRIQTEFPVDFIAVPNEQREVLLDLNAKSGCKFQMFAA